jgi:hypothetical protein
MTAIHSFSPSFTLQFGDSPAADRNKKITNNILL